jgi:hypothetical protein
MAFISQTMPNFNGLLDGNTNQVVNYVFESL